MPRFCEEKGRNWADVFQGCRERPDADDDGTRAYKRAEGRLLLPRLPRRHRRDSRRIPDEHQRAVPTGGNENGVVLYLESEPAEDAMDEFDDEIAVGFSGNGCLRFWTRCRRAAEALPNGLKYAAGGRCVITDTFTGEEKIWRVGL